MLMGCGQAARPGKFPYTGFLKGIISRKSLKSGIEASLFWCAMAEPTKKQNYLAGAALGALLGGLVGLSASPVVASVVAGLVALLGGFFGLVTAATLAPTTATVQRLMAFSLAALIATPLSVTARTHDLLSPSVASQKATLVAMGYSDGQEMREMLRFIRYGLLPSGATQSIKPVTTITTLYSAPAELCDDISRAKAPQDLVQNFRQAGNVYDRIANRLAALKPEEQVNAVSLANLYLCTK